MDDLAELFDQDDIFTVVTEYELDRGERRVQILVHEILVGTGKGNFIAFPSHGMGKVKKRDYICTGKTHEEALKQWLTQLRGVPVDEMTEL